MHEYPAKPEDQVTLANWRTAPHNTWAFQHVREIIPTADIANDPANVWQLERADVDFSNLKIPAGDGGDIGLDDFLPRTSGDGLVVMHQGRIVAERYANGCSGATPHILMSVSKSLLGLLAGILIDQGVLDEAALVTDILPELGDTGYAGATLRHLLDMRTGIDFDEDYLATSGAIVDYRKATNWNPLDVGEQPADLRSFYQVLTESEGPHGGRTRYVSPNTDLMAWVIERAAGKPYAELLSELIWRPMGAERSAYITVDRLGAPRAAGGVCLALRDLARVGQLMVQDGRRDGLEIIPAAWIDDIAENGDAAAWADGDMAEYLEGFPLSYRSKWYILEEAAPILFGIGIHGQNIYVDRAAEVVVAKVSSRASPLHQADEALGLNAARAIRDFLSGA